MHTKENAKTLGKCMPTKVVPPIIGNQVAWANGWVRFWTKSS